MSIIYKQKKAVTSYRLGEELMLYDPENDKVHTLNETAAFIWESLDGANTTEQIEKMLRQKFKDVPAKDISRDIKEALKKFKQEGLVAVSPASL